jgi:hypothetical protein
MVRLGRFERFFSPPFDFSYVRVPGLAVVVAAGLGWRLGVLCFASLCIVLAAWWVERILSIEMYYVLNALGDDVMSLHSLVTLCSEGNRRLAMKDTCVFCCEYRAMSWN